MFNNNTDIITLCIRLTPHYLIFIGGVFFIYICLSKLISGLTSLIILFNTNSISFRSL